MKIVIRLLTLVASVAGIIALVWLSSENRQLSDQLLQLEAELGRMRIGDAKRVHLVEIDQPDVPLEVASHVEGLWQFRCYLPPGYNVKRYSGGGRVAKEGLYVAGSSGSSWSSPQATATHELLTVSVQKKDNRLDAFYSLGGSSGTSSWGHFHTDGMDHGLVVQKLVSSEHGPRSFDQETILPLLKLFDPTTPEVKEVDGQSITTYAGGVFVLCPKSRESDFNRLVRGETPVGFDPSSIATAVADE